MNWTLQKYCELMCKDTDQLLLGMHISPIYRRYYSFFVLRAPEHTRMLFGSHDAAEITRLIKEYAVQKGVPKDCTYKQFEDEIMPTQAFLSVYKERFFKSDIVLTKDMENLVATVQNLDFTTPQTSIFGLDGFSTYCWTPGQKKELSIWCHSYDAYYMPVITLANALLDIADVANDHRFQLQKLNITKPL